MEVIRPAQFRVAKRSPVVRHNSQVNLDEDLEFNEAQIIKETKDLVFIEGDLNVTNWGPEKRVYKVKKELVEGLPREKDEVEPVTKDPTDFEVVAA